MSDAKEKPEECTITIEECVVYAKDRVIDELENLLYKFTLDDEKESRRKLGEKILQLATLISLPDNKYETLESLQKSNFWLGENDPYLEECDTLPLWLKGK